MSPYAFSLRELHWMVLAKRQTDWEQTSWLCAMIANTAMTKKHRRPFKPEEFNPFAKEMPKKRMSSQETKSMLRAMAGARLREE